MLSTFLRFFDMTLHKNVEFAFFGFWKKT